MIVIFIVSLFASGNEIYLELSTDFRIPIRELDAEVENRLRTVDAKKAYPAKTKIIIPNDILEIIVANKYSLTDRDNIWANDKVVKQLTYNDGKDSDYFVVAKIITPSGEVSFQHISFQYLLKPETGPALINPKHQDLNYITTKYREMTDGVITEGEILSLRPAVPSLPADLGQDVRPTYESGDSKLYSDGHAIAPGAYVGVGDTGAQTITAGNGTSVADVDSRYAKLLQDYLKTDQPSLEPEPDEDSVDIPEGEVAVSDDSVMLLDCIECSNSCKNIGLVIKEKGSDRSTEWKEERISPQVSFTLTRDQLNSTVKVKTRTGKSVNFTPVTMITDGQKSPALINLNELLNRNCMRKQGDFTDSDDNQSEECTTCFTPILPEAKAELLEMLSIGITKAAVAKTDYVFPVPNYSRITSFFGKRVDPKTGKRGVFHSGIDIAANKGTNIVAAKAGKVIAATTTNGLGKYVSILHDDGSMTRYAHCSALKVKRNQRVEQGQLIALVGRTGRSTGNHLHFEVIPDANNKRQYMDPLIALGLKDIGP